MRLFRGILYALIGLIAAAVAVTAFVVATPAGLRMALDAAEPWLPAALELPRVSGTLVGGVVVREGAWRGEQVTVEVEELELELDPWPLIRSDIRLQRLRARGVTVEIAAAAAGSPATESAPEPLRFRMPVPLAIEDARLEDVRVSGPGWSRSAAAVELSAAMRETRLEVGRLVVESDWLGLDAAGEIRLEPRYPALVDVEWRYGGGEDAPGFAGSGRIEGDADGWAVTHRLAQPEAILTEGTVELTESGFHALLDNELGQIDVALGGDRVLAVQEGHITLAGWLDGYTAEGDARLVAEGWPAVQAWASATGSLEGLQVERLRLASEAGTVEADGRLDLLPDRQWDLSFRVLDLQTEPWGAPVAAAISARGSSAGRWPEATAPRGTLTIEELSGDYGGEPLSGSGTLTIGAGGAIGARALELGVGDNSVAIDGSLRPATDLTVSLRAPRLAALRIGLEGDLRGELDLAGSVEVPVIRGSLETDGIRRDGDGLALGAARLEASAVERGSRVRLTAERVEVGGTVFESVGIGADGTPGSHDLRLALAAAGTTAEAQAAGGLADARWEGTLRSLRIAQPKLGEWTLDEAAALTLGPARAELERACLTGGAGESLCLEARTDAEGVRLAAEAGRVPLALLAPLFPEGSDFEGYAGGEADLTWRENVLDGRAVVSVPEGRIAVTLDEEQQTDLDIRSFTARFEVEANETRMETDLDLGAQGGAEATLWVADLFDPESALDGQLRVDFRDLSMVPLLVPELADVTGHVMGRIDLAGSRREPELGGALRLREAGFLFPDAGIEVTELEVVARQERPGLIDYEGSARSGEGQVRIRGSTRRVEGEGWASRFTVKGQNFRIVRLPDMQATASPDLEIVLDEKRLEVRGAIEVPEADVTLREARSDAVRTSPDTVVHGRTEAGESRLGPVLFVEVQVQLGEEVHLEGFGLDTDLTGSLRLTGGSRRPWLGFGRLSLVDARYSAYGQELTVERGELAFSGPLDNPALDIRAVRDAGEVVAGVQIGGTVRSPRSTVFSEPPLPEAEALAYLLTGRPLEGATSTEGNLLSRAALSLGLSQAGSVASQISQEVGLDMLAVEGGADDGRVLAGKRLSEDLYLEYAWGIFDQIGTLLVRYDLSDRLRLESRSGEQHSVDLVYRLERD